MTARDARRALVVGNWKMYLGAEESVRVAQRIKVLVSRDAAVADVVLCPSDPVLASVRGVLGRTRILLGAQNVHHEDRGAYTGDVSVRLLKDLVRYVIVGHSERRLRHGETDEAVAKKTWRVLKAGLHPVVCVGETAEERADDATIEKVRRQVATVLQGLPVLDISRMAFVYEPIWAIGAGPGKEAPQPDPGEVAAIVGLIRKTAAGIGGRRYAEKMRVLYGGSVTGKTTRPFVSEPGVDGVLVGGASTRPADFSAIVKEVIACRS